MALDWQPFVDIVRKHQRFLLTTHIRPDPDGLGSQLGLADVLEHMGKQVELVVSGVWPPRYTFLDPERRIHGYPPAPDSFRAAEVVVVLDTGTWNQLGEFASLLPSLSAKKVVIDHHPTQDDLGALRLVDTGAEATGRLVFEAACALGRTLSAKAAHFLFAAVATDTGWFRHQNTTAATFALAEKLVAAGAQPTLLYSQIYEQSNLPRVRLMGLALERMRLVEDGKVAYTEIRRGDYQATGAIPSDTEDLVSYTRSIAGVEVGLLFMEQPAGGVKVSFRSRESVNVSQIAENFGGGGHRLAAGAVIDGSLADAEERVLSAIRAALRGTGR